MIPYVRTEVPVPPREESADVAGVTVLQNGRVIESRSKTLRPSAFSWQRAVVISVATYGALALAYVLPPGHLRSMLSWAPAGVAAAFLIRWGSAQWIWVALGAAAAGLAVGHSWLTIGVSALITALGPLLLARYLKSTDFSPDFARRRDVVRFVISAPIAMLPPATLKVLYVVFGGLALAGHRPVAGWFEWWLNATIGTLAIAPAFVAASRDTLDKWRRQRLVAATLLAVTVGFAIPAIVVPSAVYSSLLVPMGILIVVISAARMDLTFTGALALLIAGLMSAGLAALPHAGDDSEHTMRMWAYCAILTGLTLTVRALLAERDAAEKCLRDTEVRYRRELMDAARREQERLGREMHDCLGQELTGIALMARNIELRAGRIAPELVNAARDLSEGCARATQSARSISRGLLAPGDYSSDLASALRQLAARVPASTGITVTADVEAGLKMSDEISTSFYRISQEALNNALKHACATRIRISLARNAENSARLCIEDDGLGTAVLRPSADSGFGLQTMRYRAELVGGQFTCESVPGLGTRICCTVGLSGANAGCEPFPQTATLDADCGPHWDQRRAS